MSSDGARTTTAGAPPAEGTTLSPAAARFVALFDSRAERASSNGRSWLAPTRQAAIERFTALDLPKQHDEDWRKTDLRAFAGTEFVLPDGVGAVDRSALAERIDALSLPATGEHRLVFVNGRFAPDFSTVGQLPDGVRVQPFSTLAADETGVIEARLGGLAGRGDDPFAELNTALFEDGAVIVVPSGTTVHEPIHVLFLAASNGAPMVHAPRVVVDIQRGARATLLETFAPLFEGAVYFTNALTEALVEDNARLDHYRRQQESESAFHVGRVVARQGHDSTFASFNIALGGRMARADIAVDIQGERAETLLKGLYMARGQQHIDNLTRLDHAVANCHSHERYKGILDDSASAVFTGRIYVHQDAQKTDAIQENSAILLSRDAVINTQPQLEIFADDVKCTHGATVGELPAAQRFYLEARGIPADEALGILAFGYANEIIELLEIEPLREQLESLIRDRVRQRFTLPS